jgi:hypothetical protein
MTATRDGFVRLPRWRAEGRGNRPTKNHMSQNNKTLNTNWHPQTEAWSETYRCVGCGRTEKHISFSGLACKCGGVFRLVLRYMKKLS